MTALFFLQSVFTERLLRISYWHGNLFPAKVKEKAFSCLLQQQQQKAFKAYKKSRPLGC